jgi:PAS domain S-box-containing protein
MAYVKPLKPIYSDILYVAILILLLFISFISYQRITRLNTAFGWVNHTNIVQLKLEQVLSYTKDAETAQRGLIITRDSSFTRLSRPIVAQINKTLFDLDSLTSDNPRQKENVKALRSLIGFRIEALNASLRMADRPMSELMPYLKDGQDVMDQIRVKVNDMLGIENELLKERTETKDRTAAITPFYFLIFSVLAIVVLSVAYTRLRIESKLRYKAEDSESKIHNFFNEVPAMLAILKGKEYRFEFANPFYRQFINDPNPIGKTLRETLPEIEGQVYISLLDEVYRTRKPYIGKEMPVRIMNPEGGSSLSYLNFIYQAFGNVDGNPEGMLVFCYDVSEMVDTRREIEEVEYRSRLALEAAELGTFDWDLKNQHFLSSPRLLEIFGFSPEIHASHQDLIDRFHTSDKIIRDQAVTESFKKGSLVYEARVIWPDKSVHWIRVLGKIVKGEDQPLDRMFGTVMDITRQKTILDELKESEARFRLLANSMPQLIWTSASDGAFNYSNDAFFRFSGISNEKIPKEGWFGIVHPDDKNDSAVKWKKSLDTAIEFNIEHRLRNSDGRYRWMLSQALPQKDTEGKIQLWVGTSTDIDDQKNFMYQLEEKVKERTDSLVKTNSQLEKAILELEKSNTELESFNYIASHDLQEPLRKIIAFSTRIAEKDRETLSSSSKDYFERITSAATRMQNLIDAFLAYSRMNLQLITLESTDLNELLKEVETDLHETIAEKKVTINAGMLPTAKIIPIQFQQLLHNILGNAIKYSKPNESPVIDISSLRIHGDKINMEGADPAIDYWQLTIADNGIGFEQQYEYRIFELFQRLHGKTEYSGTGIGLAICKKIMNNHEGFIQASGEPGVGAVFTIYLPVRE